MELLQLKYFCDAAQTQNFSKTAAKFLVPPSNISQSISRLEAELNIKLFDRGANKIRLNKNGEEFYLRTSKALSLIEEAKKCINNDDIRGEIRLCVRTNRNYVSAIAERFKLQYPDVSFVISHNEPDNNMDYDIIIADDTFKCDNMKKELLVRENIVLAVNKNNPIAQKEKLIKSDLEKQKFITISQPSNLYTCTVSICNQMGFEPDISFQSDDPYYVRKYLKLGWGIAFVPSFSWNGLFDSNIVFKKIGNFKRDTYIISVENEFLPKRVKLFVDMLKSGTFLD